MKITLISVLVIFTVTEASYERDYTLAQYLMIRGHSNGAFVAGGEEVLFANSTTGVKQLWRMDAGGGWPHQLTFFEEGIDYYYAHPTEDLAVLAVDRGGNERTQLYLCDTWGHNLRRITRDDGAIFGFGGFSRDGRKLVYESNERDERYFDVYLFDIETDGRELILESDDFNSSVGFSPDGRYVAFIRLHDSHNTDIFLIDLENGNELVLCTPHDGDVEYGIPRWLPDSGGFYFSSNEDNEFVELAYYDMASGERRWAERPGWDLEDYFVSWNGRYLVYEVNVEGYDELVIKDLATGETINPPEMCIGQFSTISMTTDEIALLFAHNGPDHPADLFVWDVGSKDEPKRITYASLAGIPEETLVSPELVHYETFDGLQIPAYVYVPRSSDESERAPVVVLAHGGPESQYQAWFDSMAQYFLDRGFAYVVPNARGSTGYGKSYSRLDDRFNRLDNVRDFEYLARWLAEQPWADPDRLIIQGQSYGGYSVMACLTEQPDLWAAGVEICGISNLVTFLENTGPWRQHLRESEYGYLDTDREFLEEISPVNNAHRIKAPLVVIQGANDPRVPLDEAEQIVAAARANGVPVLYLLYEDEGHGLSKLENRLDAWPKVIEFLNETLEERQ
ncbi:MAG: S9 family peptidase [Candidatus Coatesbacteria bacterium]|nr:MAG: S9 family peptidase [Candidatus Coatesbacteria bacterium]